MFQRKFTQGCAACLAFASLCLGPLTAVAGDTLDAVKKRGFVQCGVNTGLPGFSNADDQGEWTGLDVDFCRAVAAAVLGDAQKVQFTPLTAKERLTALQSGEIDVLSRNTTWTLTRDTSLGINFTGVSYYDGQGFMVTKALGIKSAKELDGAAVCILAGTTTELNLADYFRTNGMEYEPVVFDTADQTARGFEAGRCDVLTSDQSQLYGVRLKLKEADKAEILPEVISKEPLGPAVRQGDDDWFNIVRWTLFAMVNAEEFGVTAANVDEMKKSTTNPEVRRLLGLEGIKGKGLGLKDDWAYQIVKQVGNYGEVFARTVGSGSPLGIPRGLNALWRDGGLQYAPPIR
ncbi:amino acid ABC transporter substrate-binding protein [Thiorhodovibrio litoralis]|uniref:amino acid ABC transporter substrate-binding protein n=1 Tax=Thiorhodovibrio litoralis TaxID=2952932 RepID=UPI001914762E|nr:amino acid ABC transporter substrate-binding protein [Thiorhodovibrio litoralis]MBK5970972.1 amino acid ABC transporter substrate-binding protein [Thiorhodovibrio winogradskyi]WPL10661.1 General L-amino acid-binding periplasmic protein AapJ precursor [Thiorhodovibrio litoralis]